MIDKNNSDSFFNCPNFSKMLEILKPKELESFKKNCITVSFKKGENICKQNLPVTHTLYLIEGLIKIFFEIDDKSSILRIVSSEQYIGLQASFANQNYTFSISALEPSTICLIEIEYFRNLCLTNPLFLYEITKSISNCTNHIFGRLTSFNHKSVKSRLSTALLYFANSIYQSNEFHLSLSRQEMADYIGVSRENVVRLMSEMKNDKILDISGKKIIILKKKILEQIEQRE